MFLKMKGTCMKKRELKKYKNLQAVIDLQRDMSFAENIAGDVIWMIDNDVYKSYPVLYNHSNSHMVHIFEAVLESVERKMAEYVSLKKENEELKKKLYGKEDNNVQVQ